MIKDKSKTMTLKEKFKPFVFYVTESFNVARENDKEKNASKCEQIADDYAMLFAEWLVDYFDEDESCKDWDKCTKQLLEIFKKEKGL